MGHFTWNCSPKHLPDQRQCVEITRRYRVYPSPLSILPILVGFKCLDSAMTTTHYHNSPSKEMKNHDYKPEFQWPEVFSNPDLINTRRPELLCADGLCGWGICLAGNSGRQLPKSFGETLVKISQKLGMTQAPTGEGFSDHASKMGWL